MDQLPPACECGASFKNIRRYPVRCKCGKVYQVEETDQAPTWQQQRFTICMGCSERDGDSCGNLKKQGKGHILLNPRGIPNPKAECPSGHWESRQITTRNLIYHVCPIGDWRENVNHIIENHQAFNGKKVVAVAEIGEVEEAIYYLRPLEATIYLLPNDRQLREVTTFLPLLLSVQSTNSNEATFYAHTKGNSTADDVEGARLWREVMYHHLLVRWKECMKHLMRYTFVGTHKMLWPHNICPFPSGLQPPHRWMHAGTFYWFRHDEVFTEGWQKRIVMDRYGAEAFPGFTCPHTNAYSMWQPWREHESAWPVLSPYYPGLYADVRF